MEVNSLNLGAGSVRQTPQSEFELGKQRAEYVESKLKELTSKDYWSPDMQAWRPFLDEYLMAGVNHSLASKYLQYVRLAPFFEPKSTVSGKVFTEWENLLKIPGFNRIAFDTVQWSAVEDFVHKVNILYSNYKAIRRSVQSPTDLEEVVKAMNAVDTWRSLMCRAYLYCHHDIEGFTWPQLAESRAKVAEWVEQYTASFNEVRQFVADKKYAYAFYQDKCLECITRVYSQMFMQQSGSPLLSIADGLHNIDGVAAEQLISIANMSPPMYAPVLTRSDVWNILAASTVESSGDVKDSWALFTLAWPSVRGVLNRSADFVTAVKDGSLLRDLITSKTIQLSKYPNATQSLEEYIDNLKLRGFAV